jgi:hypothetical protein
MILSIVILIWIISFPINFAFSIWDSYKEGDKWTVVDTFLWMFWCAVLGPIMLILIPIHLAIYEYPQKCEIEVEEDSSW